MCPSGANAGAIGRRLGLPEAASAMPADVGLIAQIGVELRASLAKLRCHHRHSTDWETVEKPAKLARQVPLFAGIRSNPQLAKTPVLRTFNAV